MQIKDLFSHKIHSSGDDWPAKLIDIASIFAEFDGKPYNREAIEIRLSQISPRASAVARDPSKFRDEISAYPAYLGLYRVEIVNKQWHIFLSHTAKQFLVCEEPNVSAFMILQMLLFQYPNGMGAAYKSGSNSVRIQSNTRDRSLSFISNKVHLSPFRIICKGILANSILNNCSPLKATISRDAIFVLANHPSTNAQANPSIEDITNVLNAFDKGNIFPPEKYESRFHILKHTDFLVSDRNGIRIREAFGQTDAIELLKKFKAINSVNTQFNNFDNASNAEELLSEIKECSWGKYFDGVKTLDSDVVNILTHENPTIYADLVELSGKSPKATSIEVHKYANIYDFKEIKFNTKPTKPKSKKKTIYTDPEITRIKRQRANLMHKILLERLFSYLEQRGNKPYENEHIDLFVELTTKEKFVFEVKSVNETNLLSQTRKGVSQLYEYRYRYKKIIGHDVKLCLVFPENPTSVPWLQKYLCTDRDIGVIWFDKDSTLNYSRYCEKMVKPLMAKSN